MELTKEYFDQVVSGLATKKELAGLATKDQLAGLATKKDLETGLGATEKRLMQRIDEAQEELARIIADTIAAPFTRRFDALEESLAVKEDVATLKRQMSEIRSTLHLSS